MDLHFAAQKMPSSVTAHVNVFLLLFGVKELRSGMLWNLIDHNSVNAVNFCYAIDYAIVDGACSLAQEAPWHTMSVRYLVSSDQLF